MNIREKLNQFFESKTVLLRLAITAMILIIILLFSATDPFWGWILGTLKTILMPFVIGFGFAYLLHPIASFFEKYKIKRGISVLVTIVLFIGLTTLLVSSILPKLSEDLKAFALTISDSLQSLYNYYVTTSDEPSQIIKSIYEEALKMMNNFAIGLPNMISGTVYSVLNFFTRGLFAFFIGIYFVLDYEKFTSYLGRTSRKISMKLYYSLKVVDQSIKQYLRAMLIIMGITFVEYTVIYSLLGHNYALILGVLSAFALLIPYIGGTVMNVVGILTSFSLGTTKVVILGVILMILAQVDGYVISPMVYSKRYKVNPLLALFSLFACSGLLGLTGVFLAMPLYFSVDGIIKLKNNNWEPVTTSEETGA